MARPLRLHIPGMLCHVTSRGNAQQPIFEDDVDHLRYLELLARATARFKVACVAYCLMWNHVHLLLRPGDLPISRLMQQLNSTYAQWFNRRRSRTGHVLQGRFDARLVDNDVYRLRVLRYIIRNPVVARYTTHPGDWRWSSCRTTAGLEKPPAFLDVVDALGAFHGDSRVAQEMFRAFTESPADDGLAFGALLLGPDAFARQLEPVLRPHRDKEDFLYAQRFAARAPLAEVLADARKGPELDAAMRCAFLDHAYTLREISECVGRPPKTVWSRIKRVDGQNADRGQISIFSKPGPGGGFEKIEI
jgi:putative transposase